MRMFFDSFKLKKRVEELQECIEKVQHETRMLQIEWNETLDKVNHLLGRLAKRDALQARLEASNDAATGTTVESAEGAAGISSRDPISQRILALRNRKPKGAFGGL